MLRAGLTQARGGVATRWRATTSAISFIRRTIFTQDCFLGLANRSNLDKTIETQTACGPSFLLLAAQENIETPFKSNSVNVKKNESVADLVGLFHEDLRVCQYSDFPKQILRNVQSRKGLLILSFLHDGMPWDPDPLITYLARNTFEDLMSLSNSKLYHSYLKKRGVTQEQLFHMATVEPMPDESFRTQYVESFIKQVSSADVSLLSFTDVEFGYLFFGCEDETLYNAAVMLPGGALMETALFQEKLKSLLDARRRQNTALYDGLLEDFKRLTLKGAERGEPISRIEEGLGSLPVFKQILDSEYDFYINNFKMLCLKIDAYLLNQVREGEALLVNLNFPMVHNGAPHIMSLMFRKDEGVGVIVKEVFGSMENPFSIEGQDLQDGLKNSLLYCGSPSASMCVVENPDDVIVLSMQVLEAKPQAVPRNPAVQIFDNLYRVFSSDVIQLRYIDRQRFTISCPEKNWFSRMEIMARVGFIYIETEMDKGGPDLIDNGSGFMTDGGEYVEPDQIPNPHSVENYIWTFYQDRELLLSKKHKREFGVLPKGIAKPIKYPHHIGAASPLNPLKDSISRMTDHDFRAVKEFQLE